MELVLQLILLVIGFAMLMKGADWFVEGASGIADRFGIPQLVIGLTIVAMGTSAPEAAVSIAAALKGNADITIGNVLGSNIMNILVILGLTAVIIAIPVQKSTIRYEIPFMIVISGLLLFLGGDGMVGYLDGILLWVCFLAFLGYLLRMAKKGMAVTEEAPSGKTKKMWMLGLLTVIGGVLIVVGSDITVDAASAIASMFGMSQRFIGLTIVALGTSLPELLTSVTAGMKGKADIAIGNIVGSNIFNILFVVGTTALITPVSFQPRFFLDAIISIAAGVLLLLCIFREGRLRRFGGVVMLLCYAGYFVWLIVTAGAPAASAANLIG